MGFRRLAAERESKRTEMPCCPPMLAAQFGLLQQATYAKFTKPGESTKQTPPVHVRVGCCNVVLCPVVEFKPRASPWGASDFFCAPYLTNLGSQHGKCRRAKSADGCWRILELCRRSPTFHHRTHPRHPQEFGTLQGPAEAHSNID